MKQTKSEKRNRKNYEKLWKIEKISESKREIQKENLEGKRLLKGKGWNERKEIENESIKVKKQK